MILNELIEILVTKQTNGHGFDPVIIIDQGCDRTFTVDGVHYNSDKDIIEVFID